MVKIRKLGFVVLLLGTLSVVGVGAQSKARIAGYGAVTAGGVTTTAVVTTTSSSDPEALKKAQEGVLLSLVKALGGAPNAYVLTTLLTDEPVAVELHEYPLESLRKVVLAKGYDKKVTHGVYVNFPSVAASGGKQVFSGKLAIRMHFPAGNADTATTPFIFDGESKVVALADAGKDADVLSVDVTKLTKTDAELVVGSWYGGDPCCGW